MIAPIHFTFNSYCVAEFFLFKFRFLIEKGLVMAPPREVTDNDLSLERAGGSVIGISRMRIKKLIRLKHRLPLNGDNDACVKIYALSPYEPDILHGTDSYVCEVPMPGKGPKLFNVVSLEEAAREIAELQHCDPDVLLSQLLAQPHSRGTL
jgi:hypothetical protein